MKMNTSESPKPGSISVMKMNSTESPKPGSIVCIFCRCVVNYFHGDKEKFLQHLRYEHSIQFFEHLMLAINLTNRTNLDVIIDVFGGDKEESKIVSKEELLKRVMGDENIEASKEKSKTDGESVKKKGRPSKKIDLKDQRDLNISSDPQAIKSLNKINTSVKENFSSPALKGVQTYNKSLVISSKKAAPKVTENKIAATKITPINGAIPAKNILHTRSRSQSQGGNVDTKSQSNSSINQDVKKRKPNFSNPKARKNIIAEHKNLPQRGFIKKNIVVHKKDSVSAQKEPSGGNFLKCYYKNKMFPLNSLKKTYVKLDKGELKTAQNNLRIKNLNKAPTKELDDNIIIIEDDQDDSVNLNQSIIDIDSSMNNSLLQKIMKSNNITFVKNPHEAQKDHDSGVEIIKTVEKVQRNPLPPKTELLTINNLPKANKKPVESEYCTFCILCDKTYEHDGLSKKMFLRKHMSEKHDARISSAADARISSAADARISSAADARISSAGPPKHTEDPEPLDTNIEQTTLNVPLNASTSITEKVQLNLSTTTSEKGTLNTTTPVPKKNIATPKTKKGPLNAATPVHKKIPMNIATPVSEKVPADTPKPVSKPSKPEKGNESKKGPAKQNIIKTDIKKAKSGPGRKKKNPEKCVENKNAIPDKDVSSAKVEDSSALVPSQNVKLAASQPVLPTNKSIKTEGLSAQIDQTSNEKMSNKRKRRPSEILNFKLSNPEKMVNARESIEKDPADVGTNAEKLLTKINQMNNDYSKQKKLAERKENPSANPYVPTVKFENLTIQTPKPKTDLERNIENLVSNHISTDLLSQSLGHQVIIERKRRIPEGAVPATGNRPSTQASIAETSKSMIHETQQMLKYSDKLINEYNLSVNSETNMSVNGSTNVSLNNPAYMSVGNVSNMFVHNAKSMSVNGAANMYVIGAANNSVNMSVNSAVDMSINNVTNTPIMRAAPNIKLIKSEFTSEGLGKISDYFKYNPNLVHPVGNQASQFCSVDESLPKGWKVRIVKSGSRIEKQFLSPEDLVLKSRKAVEEYINILAQF